jgi:uncharacterized protein YerC
MRTSDTPLDPELRDEISHLLPQLLTDIHSEKDMQVFLEDFFSKKELEVFSKRLAIMYWLKRKRSYKEMKEQIKVSSATIASMQEISTKPGIELAWKVLEANEWAEKISSRIKRIVGK